MEAPTAGAKPPASPFGGSSAATASTAAAPGGEGSGGSARAALLSAEEANFICSNVLKELSQDVATVTVTSSGRGWVCGRLEWAYGPLEEVSFSLVAVGAGRAFVGEVEQGPELFRKVSWRLKSLNGAADFDPVCITRGDRVVLEGPSWATERLQPAAAATAAAAAAAAASAPGPGAGLPASACSSRAAASPVGASLQGDFELVPAGRAARPSPVIPKLDLRGMQGPSRSSQSRQGGFIALCGGGCPQDQPPVLTDILSLGKCYSLWNCMGGGGAR